jgi:hypothetical protein
MALTKGFLNGNDLNLFSSFFCKFHGSSSFEVSYDFSQEIIYSDHGVRYLDKYFTNCGSLWRRLRRATPDCNDSSVIRHGFCATDLAR